MAKDPANRNITRIDNAGGEGKRPVRGFEVRIYRRGQRFNQFFSDSAHGGKKAALEESRTVRDKMEKKLKPYTRRADYDSLDKTSRAALDWFQTSVPERTLHNWQNAAAKLISEDIRTLV